MRTLPRISLLGLLVWGASPSASLPYTVSGQVVDARTGAGIDLLPVTLGAVADTTRDGGRFRVENERPGRLVVRGASQGFSVFLVDPFDVSRDTTLTIFLIPLGPMKSGYYRNLLHLLKMMTATGEPSDRAQEDVSISYESSPRTTILRRWDRLPIRIHIPHYARKGFLWEKVVTGAVDRWEERTGLDLFRPVGDPEEAQVRVRYGGSYSRIVFERAGPGGVPLAATLWISPELARADEVQSSAEHELGHALMLLVHSEDPGHVMYWGGSAGREVTSDEAILVRCLYGLPNLTDVGAYVERVPLSRRMIEQKRVLAVVLIQAMVALFVIMAAH